MGIRLLAALLALVAAGAAVPSTSGAEPAAAVVTGTVDGYDWSLPGGTTRAPNSGFYSESPSPRIDLRSVDVTWRQVQPRPGALDPSATGSVYGTPLPSLADQLASPGSFWMRMFASGKPWAPRWVTRQCGATTVGPGDDGMRHLPIWRPCVWSRLRDTWRALMIDAGLRSDDRLRFVYVPGAFAYAEFDYAMVDAGVRQAGLTFRKYRRWHQRMLTDLVTIMNGDNDDPSDDYADKLVYTGEDYPYSETFGDRVALFARKAVSAGMGIRNGITEIFNAHLGEVPAYGTTIGADGHLHTDDGWQLFDGRRIAAAENECYTDCGLHSKDPLYSVPMSNLKALQMRMNWIYAVPGPSRFNALADHWAWVRLELGHTVATAPDAWVALRDAEDRYWKERGDRTWDGFPYVRNLERWLVQRDIAADGTPVRGSLVRQGDPHPYNGRSYESLRTDVANGQDRIYFDVDDQFLGPDPGEVELKVTYRDYAGRSWRVGYRSSAHTVVLSPPVAGSGDGSLRTVTFAVSDASFDDGLAASTDFYLEAVTGDLEASFVRVVKMP
ncbi:hypothetical protein F0U44_19805 [Nocardioides humilatus]|uniref:Uncharacterized protein n=1 Tax=Nocardioides humilatus TaxID=2607660 RepID=A0A5B1L5F7_9ACTN|nr:hypothetical protein [Nocardioides humilatus]KAA1415883.1 hypothetical protein F0U44_19805 [Nocardioides humilatus]